jgi:phage-related protein
MVIGKPLKPVRWVGSSRKDVQSFPQQVRLDFGYAIYAAQKSETDPAATPKKEVDLIKRRLAEAERDYKERHS